MAWLRLLRALGFASVEMTHKHEGIAHDFTSKLSGQELMLVKPLNNGVRVFLVGLGSHPVVGDMIVTKNKNFARVVYRIEKIKHGDAGTWRAYGRLEQSNALKTRYGHPRASVIKS